MMKLSTMKAAFETLDEQWHSPLADVLVARWGITPGAARIFRASANFLFKFQQSNHQYILRFNHECERTPAWVQGEIDFIRHLARAGILVPKPLSSLTRTWVESVATRNGIYHAVVFEALAGEQYNSTELTYEQWIAWGKALAELHTASQGYAGHDRPSWQDHLHMAAQTIPPQETTALRLMDTLRNQLTRLPVTSDNFGLIHYDFELDNLIWQRDRPGIIDLDDSAWYWYAADLAFGLRDLFDDRPAGIDLSDERFLTFIQGYRQVRSISDEELSHLSLFLRLHNLVIFARLLRSLEGSAPPDEPQWLGELRGKLERLVASYRASFADAQGLE